MMYLFPEAQYFAGMLMVPLGNIGNLVNYLTSKRIKVLEFIVSYLL